MKLFCGASVTKGRLAAAEIAEDETRSRPCGGRERIDDAVEGKERSLGGRKLQQEKRETDLGREADSHGANRKGPAVLAQGPGERNKEGKPEGALKRRQDHGLEGSPGQNSHGFGGLSHHRAGTHRRNGKGGGLPLDPRLPLMHKVPRVSPCPPSWPPNRGIPAAHFRSYRPDSPTGENTHEHSF